MLHNSSTPELRKDLDFILQQFQNSVHKIKLLQSIVPSKTIACFYKKPIDTKAMKEMAISRLAYLRDVEQTITAKQCEDHVENMRDW